MRESQMKFREESKYWVKKGSINNCVGRDACLLEKSLDEKNLFSGKELLPNPYVSFSTNIRSAHGINKTENKEPVMCQRIHGKVLVESSQCAGRKMFNKSHFPNISWTNQVGNWETEDFKNSEVKCSHSFMDKNNINCKKGPQTWEGDFTWFYKRHSLYEKESILAPFDRHHCKNADEAQKVKYNNHHFTTHCSNCLHAYPVPSVHVQKNAQCKTKVWVPVQGGFQKCNGMKIHKTSHVLGRSSCDSVCSQQFSGYQVNRGYKLMKDITFETKAKNFIPVCRKEGISFPGFCNVINDTLPFHASVYSKSFSGFGVHKEYELRKKLNSETEAKKWVPVQTVERTGSAVVCNVFSDTSPSSCGDMNDRNSNGNRTFTCGSATSSDSKSIEDIAPLTTEMSSNENAAPTFENESAKVVHASESTNGSMIEVPKVTLPSINGSQVAAETLNAAYLLQLESERAELEMGQPLAEFERFIHSASPVISFSHRCAPCAVCSVSQLSSSFLCKHQKANISLHALWNWYQKPGNYGLEVKAVDYKNQKGTPTEMTPFQAHFIPFLSAVQLFAYLRPEKQEVELNSSSPKALLFKHSVEAIQPGHFWVGNKTSGINLDSIEEVCISNNSSSRKRGDSQGFLSLINCPCDSELIFEFFESEPPHQRKPLHMKIAELIKAGNSNLVSGDPSKLESLDLHDLHPAS
ncbi:hypothetical protein CRYUN_Cryun04dG0100200 [Craigia yunnanensis]